MTNFITHTIEPWMPVGALKAKSDYTNIAQNYGWTEIPLARYNDTRFDNQTRTKKIDDWLNNVHKYDTVLHQFPTYMSEHFEKEFALALKQRQTNTAILIHDIEPLRIKKDNSWEFNVLNLYDTVIVHSEAMANQLAEHGVNSQFIIQPLFDYLGPCDKPAKFSQNVNFAGTFQKSPWLQETQDINITLFGSKPKKWQKFTFPDNINYQGNFDPDEILLQLQDGFGLIWDNDFDDKTYQNYTKFNTPHKASLYLRAGLPLIAWRHSAIGQIINNKQIGFVIDDLSTIHDMLSSIDEQQYNIWQANIMPLASQLSSGNFTRQTLSQLAN